MGWKLSILQVVSLLQIKLYFECKKDEKTSWYLTTKGKIFGLTNRRKATKLSQMMFDTFYIYIYFMTFILCRFLEGTGDFSSWVYSFNHLTWSSPSVGCHPKVLITYTNISSYWFIYCSYSKCLKGIVSRDSFGLWWHVWSVLCLNRWRCGEPHLCGQLPINRRQIRFILL